MTKWPSKIRFTTVKKDGVGFWKMTFQGLVLVEAKTIDAVDYPTAASDEGMKFWLDGNQLAPAEQEYDIPAQKSLFIKLYRSKTITKNSDNLKLSFEFKINGEWTDP